MKQFAIIALISCLHFSNQLFSQSSSKTSNLGANCSDAIPVCADYTVASMPVNSSGITPSCFASAPQRDIWLAFHVVQSGDLAWKGNPNDGTTEFDWALWDVTSGCPLTGAAPVCCSYNYAGGSTNGFGMQAQTGTVVCGYAGMSSPVDPLKEFSAPVNVTAGKKYSLQISNFDNTAVGFSLSFVNSTCLVDCALGLSENDLSETQTVIFPVPASNELSISSRTIIQNVELISLTGQVLLNTNVNQKEHQLHLDLFTEGIYFVKMIFENEKITYKKIVISK